MPNGWGGIVKPIPLKDRLSLRKWWHRILRAEGSFSCYALYLILPSDKETLHYLGSFGKELDTISGDDCLVMIVAGFDARPFRALSDIPEILSQSAKWRKAVKTQALSGYSIELAEYFHVDIVKFPCMLIFRDIRSPEHIIVSLKGLSSDDVAKKMREIFSLIKQATSDGDDPIVKLERQRNKQRLIEKGKPIVSAIRNFTDITIEALVKSWLTK